MVSRPPTTSSLLQLTAFDSQAAALSRASKQPEITAINSVRLAVPIRLPSHLLLCCCVARFECDSQDKVGVGLSQEGFCACELLLNFFCRSRSKKRTTSSQTSGIHILFTPKWIPSWRTRKHLNQRGEFFLSFPNPVIRGPVSCMFYMRSCPVETGCNGRITSSTCQQVLQGPVITHWFQPSMLERKHEFSVYLTYSMINFSDTSKKINKLPG